MPYILKDKRTKITPVLKGDNEIVNMDSIDCAGDLNYAFTKLAINYIKRKGLNYQNVNDVSGAFTEALAEFRRRLTAPYENDKISLNGDVYPSEYGRLDEDVT